MTVDYHYHFNRCMKNPSFISEDYCVTVSIAINTTIFSITTRLLFVHFFYLHVYIFYIYVQLTEVWLFVLKIKLNWTELKRFKASVVRSDGLLPSHVHAAVLSRGHIGFVYEVLPKTDPLLCFKSLPLRTVFTYTRAPASRTKYDGPPNWSLVCSVATTPMISSRSSWTVSLACIVRRFADRQQRENERRQA